MNQNKLSSLLDLLLEIPFLIMENEPFPSLIVLNDLLEKGKCDHGMSGSWEWEPIQLSNENYINLFGLAKNKFHQLVYVEPPKDIVSFKTWTFWKIWRKAGIHTQYLKFLFEESAALNNRIKLLNNEDSEKLTKLQLRTMEIDWEINEFISPYFNNPNFRTHIYFYSVKNEYGFLSNFYKSTFFLDGKEWASSEHYFQAQKFLDLEYKEKIRLARTPTEAARLGRNRKVPIRSDWEIVKDDCMLNALRAKFTQNATLKQKLLQTLDAELIERTEKDSYWGDGGDGSGKNMLGILLMQVRDELIKTDEKMSN